MQMGDSTQPFREVGNAHDSQNRELVDFNFSACDRADDELGGFNFDMGCLKDACGHGAAASTAAIDGVEAFFELSDAARASCTNTSYGAIDEAGNDAAGYGSFGESGNYDTHTFSEEGDDSRLEWVSPRISFSQDLAMAEFEASCSSRGFATQGKWREGSAENGGEPHYGSSSEFEFLSSGVIYDGFAPDPKDVMISAEELFSDGKLLPMHIQEKASSNGELNMQSSEAKSFHVHSQMVELSSNELFVPSSQLALQESHADEPDSVAARPKLTARHLSLELPRPHSSSITSKSTPFVSGSVDNSPFSSPPRSSNPPPNASPAPQKASSKYSSRIKDFFKPKRISSSTINPQLTRDNSTTSASTCRIPIPPRTFWPFSRSNSAGESKTGTPPPPMLPPRSNSAGESNTSRVTTASKKCEEAPMLERKQNSNILHGQDGMVSANENDFHIAKTHTDVGSAEDCIDVGSSRQHTEEGVDQASIEEECVPSTSSHKSSVRLNKGRASGSPGRAARRRYMYSTANFLRGSPGRRGGTNSGVKVNASRIVLRNLERCSADRKLCRDTSGRRAVAYPVALRVSPVLNVAVYRGGKVPSSGMFGLRSLFSSNKEKTKDKDAAVLNNWRAGA